MPAGSIDLGDIERHFWLTRSVARITGVNLSRAMAERRFDPEAYAMMVSTCRASGCDAACQRWLAAQTSTRPDDPPEYCAIAEKLAQLR